MAEKIMTQHPDPEKQGVNLDKKKYDKVREAILAIVGEAGEITFKDLMASLHERLPQFKGSVGWYGTTIKLDLEARGLIERVPDVSPQVLRMKK